MCSPFSALLTGFSCPPNRRRSLKCRRTGLSDSFVRSPGHLAPALLYGLVSWRVLEVSPLWSRVDGRSARNGHPAIRPSTPPGTHSKTCLSRSSSKPARSVVETPRRRGPVRSIFAILTRPRGRPNERSRHLIKTCIRIKMHMIGNLFPNPACHVRFRISRSPARILNSTLKSL